MCFRCTLTQGAGGKCGDAAAAAAAAAPRRFGAAEVHGGRGAGSLKRDLQRNNKNNKL